MFRDEKEKEIGLDGMQFSMDGVTVPPDEKVIHAQGVNSTKDYDRSKVDQSTVISIRPLIRRATMKRFLLYFVWCPSFTLVLLSSRSFPKADLVSLRSPRPWWK